jgi:hypothetical protein
VATGLQGLGIPTSTITHVLNQSEGGSRVTPIYARHDFSEEKKTALEAWGRSASREIRRYIEGMATRKVIRIALHLHRKTRQGPQS